MKEYIVKKVTGKLNNPDDSLVTDDSEACKEQKSKLDLISRQAAIDMIDGMIADATSHGITARLDPYYVRHGLEYLPPVEPKRPKTTETMMIDGEPTEIDPESYEVGYTHGQMASKRPTGECRTCKRCSDHCCETAEDFTRCPIEKHYSLPKDGYCHLYEQI